MISCIDIGSKLLSNKELLLSGLAAGSRSRGLRPAIWVGMVVRQQNSQSVMPTNARPTDIDAPGAVAYTPLL